MRCTALHPSRDRTVVAEVVEEHPELIERMDYYLDARLLDGARAWCSCARAAHAER